MTDLCESHTPVRGTAVCTVRGRALLAALTCLALLVAALGAGRPAAGQTTVPAPTTTSPAPTTTAPPGTTTTAPPPPPPQDDPGGEQEDAPPSEVPKEEVDVPPSQEPAQPDPMADVLKQVAKSTIAEVRRSLKQTERERERLAERFNALSAEVGQLEGRLAQLQAEKAQAAARLQQARLQLRKRAVAGYMGSPAGPVTSVLEAEDFNDLSRRFSMLKAVAEADRARMDEYDRARAAAGRQIEEVIATLDTKRAELLVAGISLEGVDSALLAKQIQLAAVSAGGGILGAGFVFPVGGPSSFTDTFGAPRMFGTPYAHLHQGTDIFAAHGTPLLACERGVLIRVGTDTLGGTKLWLVGASGTRYYYAHLSGYAPGVAEGLVVSAGDVIGYVGNTGNASTTPAHLHFQVHPNGGAPVNPYPLLRMVADAQQRYNASRGTPPRGSKS